MTTDLDPGPFGRLVFVNVVDNWHDGKIHNPEDARTGRLIHQTLAYGPVSSAGQYQIKNLPPGNYSVFVGPVIALQGTQVTAVAGVNTTADIVWRLPELTDSSEVEIGNLHRHVRLETKPSAMGTGYLDAFTALYQELGRNYPCFDLKNIDWEAVGKELLPRAREVNTERDFALLCAELVARLEDSHAYLMPDAAKFPSMEYPRWDPGFACLIDDRGRPEVRLFLFDQFE